MANQQKSEVENVDKRYSKEVKGMLEVVRRSENSYVFLVARYKEDALNAVRKLPARRGLPIGGYVFDTTNDCYLIKCADFLTVGYVPISLKLEMEGVKSWCVDIPVPDNLIRKHLTTQQRTDVKRFMMNFDPSSFDFEFVQLLGPH